MLLALSASGVIAGKNEVKHRPSLVRAPRARKAYPRNVNETCSCSCSCSHRRLPSFQVLTALTKLRFGATS